MLVTEVFGKLLTRCELRWRETTLEIGRGVYLAGDNPPCIPLWKVANLRRSLWVGEIAAKRYTRKKMAMLGSSTQPYDCLRWLTRATVTQPEDKPVAELSVGVTAFGKAAALLNACTICATRNRRGASALSIGNGSDAENEGDGNGAFHCDA
jgi:hypothetical protein